MNRFGKLFLSLGAPFLILVATVGLFQREGRERLQAIPALLVGSGLIIASAIRRDRRRKMLLFEIRNRQEDEI